MCSQMHFGLYKPLQERCHRIPSSLQFCPYSRRKARTKSGTGTCAVPSLSNIFGQTLWLWLVFREIPKLGLPSSRQIALRLLWACKKKFVRISSDPKVGTVQKVLAVGKHRSLRCAYPSISSRSMNLFSKEECLNLHKSQLSECHWRAFAKILGTGTLQAPGTITYDPSISILVGRIYKRGLAHSHVEKQQQSSIDKNIRRPI